LGFSKNGTQVQMFIPGYILTYLGICFHSWVNINICMYVCMYVFSFLGI
jgi:hypothetical protein